MAASPDNSLFAKVLSCLVSVVKADHVQDGAKVSVFMATNRPFWLFNLLPFCLSVSFKEMILPRLKSSYLAGFCKLNCHWSPFQRKLG